MTKKPHIAGRDIDEKFLVDFIKQEWMAAGLKPIQVFPYNVLLSYPQQSDSNYVAVMDKDGSERDVSQKKELVIDPEQNDPDVVNPFNAFSASGSPQVNTEFKTRQRTRMRLSSSSSSSSLII